MLIKVRDNRDIPSSEITDEETFYNRRLILKSIGLGVAAASTGVGASQRQLYRTNELISGPDWLENKLTDLRPGDHFQ